MAGPALSKKKAQAPRYPYSREGLQQPMPNTDTKEPTPVTRSFDNKQSQNLSLRAVGRQLAEHPCTFASTFESCSFHVKQSKQSARRRIVKTKVAKKTFRATVGPFILAERLRLRKPAAKGRIAVFARPVKKRVLGAVCDCWVSFVLLMSKVPKPSACRFRGNVARLR